MPRRTFAQHQAFLSEYPFSNIRDEQAAQTEFKFYANKETARLQGWAKQDRAEANAKSAEVQERYDDLDKQAERLERDLENGRITFEEAKPKRQAILREQRLLGGLIDGMESQYKRANEIEEDPLTYYDKTIARFPSMYSALPDWSI